MCYSKYACVILLKHKRELQLLMLFKHFSMNHKANQIEYGLTKYSEFYNRSMKSFLHNN